MAFNLTALFEFLTLPDSDSWFLWFFMNVRPVLFIQFVPQVYDFHVPLIVTQFQISCWFYICFRKFLIWKSFFLDEVLCYSATLYIPVLQNSYLPQSPTNIGKVGSNQNCVSKAHKSKKFGNLLWELFASLFYLGLALRCETFLFKEKKAVVCFILQRFAKFI